MSIRVTVITGRDKTLIAGAIRAAKAWPPNMPAEVLVHPWVTEHPADGARAFIRMLGLGAPRHLIIVTMQDWVVNILGELIELRPDLVAPQDVFVVLCEGGVVRRCSFDAKGYLDDNWPIGYFTTDDVR